MPNKSLANYPVDDIIVASKPRKRPEILRPFLIRQPETILNILAIDTSTEACSAALLRSDGMVFSEFEVAPRQHTRLLPKMMDAVLASAGCARKSLSYCAFANGPGAFTGVRIAASTAQGIGIALKIPLVPVSTLATLAQVSLDQQSGDTTLVALDARMSEVYWGVYRHGENDLAELIGEEKLNRIADVNPDYLPSCGAGHGWSVGQETWRSWADPEIIQIDETLLPDSRALLKLAVRAIEQGQICTSENISINYLRNQVAEKSKKR